MDVWREMGVHDYMDTLKNDVNHAYTQVYDHGDWEAAKQLAKDRKGTDANMNCLLCVRLEREHKGLGTTL